MRPETQQASLPKEKLAVGAEQVRLLYANRLPPLINSAVLAGIFAVVQWEALPHASVLTWLMLIWLITLAQVALNIAYKRLKPDASVSKSWLIWFRLAALVSGAMWGLGGVMLFPSQDIAHQGFLAFMLAGVTIDAVVSYSADRLSVIGFLLLALMPFVMSAFTESHHVSHEIGLGILLFFGFAIGNVFKLYRSLRENIALRIRAESSEKLLRQKRLDLHQFNRQLASSVHKLHRNLRENETLRLRAESGEELLRKREADLKALNDRLTVLIESIPDAILFKDGEGRLLIANEVAKRQFHLHDVAWKGKTEQDLVAFNPALSKLYQSDMQEDEEAWSLGALRLFEREIVDDQGQARAQEIRKVPILDLEGQRTGLVTIARDVTEYKAAMQELRISAAAFDGQEGILITDANNKILRVNRAFTTLTGYSAEEAIGQTPAMLRSGRHDTAFYQRMWAALKFDKYWQGDIWNRRKNGWIYPQWTTISAILGPDKTVTHYISSFSDITQYKQAEEEIHKLAFFDQLTGLPNRRLLLDRLQQACSASARRGQYGAIFFIDLDNFKALNDTRGHDVGDLLLVEVAERLSSCVRGEDTVARLGGDEFVVMLEGLGETAEQAVTFVEMVAEKILVALNQPYLLNGLEHYSTPSIGISLFLGETEAIDELLKHADTAMYQAKQSGRNTMRFFDPAMQAVLEARLHTESDLRQALPQEQLQLYYQLQVNQSRQIVGAEALLRWQHPERGLISPEDFIPVAEEIGLIVPIGLWVLQIACAQLKRWEHNPLMQHLQLSVNVSARQFRQPDFVEHIQQILHQAGANPALLKLELTESLVMGNLIDTVEKMQALQSIGVRFSLDDFGTGHSSLAQLKRLPLHQVKIDQDFVRDIASDPNDAAIVQAIIAMTEALGFDVIAEGVETEAQLAFLKLHGCQQFQGFLFGEPMLLTEFERVVNGNR